jgi:RIO-like serine/threonine protein kinase
MSAAATLERSDYERLPRQQLGRPSILKPAVWKVEAPGGVLVVKDVRHSLPAMRWIARWLLRREQRVLERLTAVKGVPHLAAAIDRDAIALTWVEGRTLDKWMFRQRPRELIEQLRELTEQMHAAGVFHLDLHQRNNLLVDEAGRLSIVDFGAAIAPGPLARALFGRFLRVTDLHAAHKYLARFTPEELTEEEARAVLQQHRVLRRLWPFAQKRSRETRAARRRLT